MKAEMVYVALGSNLGDRAKFLADARRAMDGLPESRIVAESDVEETLPIGPPGQGPYLNQMVALETSLSPHELLSQLQAIEQAAGRVRTERWGPRTLDLDIVQYGDHTIRDPDLVVPHPELPHRDFWQRELAQVRGGAMP
jgi:2-amino-4-hydroxy-6-hydroxymethyldihydropteridine diphosphokinase